jgi:exosortase family protein XrtF
MLENFWKNPLYRFLSTAAVLFIIWVFAYEYWIYDSWLDQASIDNLTWISSSLLELFNFELIAEYDPTAFRTIGIDGTGGLWIGNECDGLYLFAIFSIVLVSFPGNWKQKSWFIPVSIAIIHLVNVLRIVALAITLKYSPDMLDFNHTYVFQVVIYGVIFYLWYIWVSKIGTDSLKANKQ